ncbi:hypothetical protein EGW08_022375 [Elysia chlorotica]|uniref:UspA domain-containing protein n=1 Tax=Elysia chlorotica TaxID=188477 RepID=A0A3S1AXK5_ELYCH|nr:hypothetical protein EGW08_022375 [Elysia chlorotica]
MSTKATPRNSISKSDSVDDSSEEEEESITPPKTELRSLMILKEGPIVVMPLDASKHSLYCLTFYIKYLHKPENMVHVCYVAEDYKRKSQITDSPDKKSNYTGCFGCIKRLLDRGSFVDNMGPSPGIIKELKQEDRLNCRLVRAKAKTLFLSNDVKNWAFTRLTGEDPWTAILDHRESVRGTLLVLGSRGLGVIKRTIFGSVSDKVLRKSTVPVLIVRMPEGALCSTIDVVTGSSFIH